MNWTDSSFDSLDYFEFCTKNIPFYTVHISKMDPYIAYREPQKTQSKGGTYRRSDHMGAPVALFAEFFHPRLLNSIPWWLLVSEKVFNSPRHSRLLGTRQWQNKNENLFIMFDVCIFNKGYNQGNITNHQFQIAVVAFHYENSSSLCYKHVIL